MVKVNRKMWSVEEFFSRYILDVLVGFGFFFLF